MTDLQKTEAGKKLSVAGQEALKQARYAAEKIEEAAKVVGDTQVYKQVATTTKAVATEIDSLADLRMYSRPGIAVSNIYGQTARLEQLKLRSEGFSSSAFSSRPVEANT